MALPAIAPAARAAQTPREKPSILSPEGIVMLMIAGLIEVGNIVLAILDMVFGIGTVLAPIVNGVATFIIGGWLWLKTGKLPLKKALLPFALNIIPIVRFFPFWLWSVWSSLDRGQTQQEDQRRGGISPRAAQAPA